ncbi:MAG: hypothetical protein HZA78_06645 [Candidatus Schekmanbacteria bacterium]|nr:hypothetical protein [Candidatus Schekmanbacteria bacterium]
MTNTFTHNPQKTLKLNPDNSPFFLLPALILIVLQLYGGPHPGDDAYITYRYVKNLLNGNGFVYNPGESVLGTTTPLYTMILAVLTFPFGLKYLLWISLLFNITCNLASLYFLRQIGKKLLPDNDLLLNSALLLFALNPAITIQTKLGMEPPLYILTALAALYYISRDAIGKAACYSALHLLTRPDGLILAAAVSAYLILTAPEKIGKYLLIILTLTLPWLVFAGYKFGSPIPQTLIAKSQAYETYPWLFVKYYWRHLRRSFWGYFFKFWEVKEHAVSGAAVIFFIIIGLANLKRTGFTYLFLAYPFAYLLIFIIANPLYAPRYIAPIEPFLIIFVLAGIYSALNWIVRNLAVSSFLKKPLTILTFSFIIISQFHHYNLIPAMWGKTDICRGTYDPAWLHPLDCPRQKMREDLFRQTALYLNRYINENTSIALPEIGTFGYYSKGRILDTVGLISPEAVNYYPLKKEQVMGNNAVPPGLIYERQPEYIVTYEAFVKNSLVPEKRFQQMYTVFRSTAYFHFWGDDRVIVFKKRI